MYVRRSDRRFIPRGRYSDPGAASLAQLHRRCVSHYHRRTGPSSAVIVRDTLLKHIEPLLALVVGILILMQPNLLGFIVAIYLIVIGTLGLVRNLKA